MLRKLLPVLLALIGTGAGVGVGLFLMPEAGVSYGAPTEEVAHHTKDDRPAGSPSLGREYVKLNNQFVVPVIHNEQVEALVVASLSIEVISGSTQTVYAREPKLRDVLLQVMFDYANIGGFTGGFTTGERMQVLRNSLLEAAQSVLGADVSDVLITEIARQDS